MLTLQELCFSPTAVRHGINNMAPPELHDNLYALAMELDAICHFLQAPIDLLSGYRCPYLNALVRGQEHSQHLKGLAADFVMPHFGDPLQVIAVLATSPIKFDQLIYEGAWVHISFDEHPRHEILQATFRADEPTVYRTI